jgi:hypothetical protein
LSQRSPKDEAGSASVPEADGIKTPPYPRLHPRYTRDAVPVIDDTTLMTLVAAGVLAIVAIGLALMRRHSQHLLDRLAPAFLFQGYSCRYRIEQRSQYSPGGATLRVRAASPLRWSASRNDAASRLLASIGILRDLAIGDEELDNRLRLSAGDAPMLMSLLGQQRTRAALRALAGTEGFASISVRTGRADLKWSPRRAELDEDPTVLRHRLGAAVDLLAACGCAPLMG